MQGIKDLFASERGIFAIILSLSSTAFVIAGKMTIDQWNTFNTALGITLVASKTVTTTADMFRRPKLAAGSGPLPTATTTTTATPKSGDAP